jgi:hypothetical protein
VEKVTARAFSREFVLRSDHCANRCDVQIRIGSMESPALSIGSRVTVYGHVTGKGAPVSAGGADGVTIPALISSGFVIPAGAPEPPTDPSSLSENQGYLFVHSKQGAGTVSIVDTPVGNTDEWLVVRCDKGLVCMVLQGHDEASKECQPAQLVCRGEVRLDFD